MITSDDDTTDTSTVRSTVPSTGTSTAGERLVVPTRTGGKMRVYVVLGLIVVALGVVVVRGLGDATQLFRPADEAIAKIDQIGDKRFSIIGAVVADTVVERGRDVRFTIEQNGVQVPVRHTGVPPELFQPGIPVVLDGRFQTIEGTRYFVSDRMAVQHSNVYQSENPDRVQQPDLSAQ
jgi:cytochrome c-type biogenesis protein CcmE